jgi:hypothetical protein
MADLKSLNESLVAAARILDDAATEIRDIPLNPKKDNISHIAEALSHIFEIQKEIYKVEPSLEPEYLKRPSPYPAKLHRQFGEIVIRDADLCDLGEYKEAISMYENFIAQDPPEFFIKMAENRISKIKSDYCV